MHWFVKWTHDEYLERNIPVQALGIQVFLWTIQEKDIKKHKKYSCLVDSTHFRVEITSMDAFLYTVYSKGQTIDPKT